MVTRHHKPNNNNSYTRKELVYGNCVDHEKLIRSFFDISPTPTRVDDIKAAGAHHLSTCHECNKQLYMGKTYTCIGNNLISLLPYSYLNKHPFLALMVMARWCQMGSLPFNQKMLLFIKLYLDNLDGYKSYSC